MDKPLEELEARLGVTFKNKELLKEALTHSSYRLSHRGERVSDNERLEFLGDALLNLCISLYLYEKFPEDREGELTKKRSYLVCRERLIKVAENLNLWEYMYVGRRERALDEKGRKNIAGRTVEALIGAIFLDQGLEKTCEVVRRLFLPYIRALRASTITDYKTKLQEYLQKTYGAIPQYEVTSISGPAHRPEIEVAVSVGGKIIARAKGTSRKEAENLVAKRALYKLRRGQVP